MRVVVPDVKAIVMNYVKTISENDQPLNDAKNLAADSLNKTLLLRSPEPFGGGILFRLYNLLNDFHHHKWMYDSQSLIFRFHEASFIEVSEMKLFQSQIESIRSIESPDRILNGAGICIEGKKPV